MKFLFWIELACGITSVETHAHDVYISQSRLHNAIRVAFPNNVNSGLRGDCFSCHDNVPSIPGSGFGFDSRARKQVLFPAVAGALTQAQLQTLVLDNALGNQDSDGDGFNNRLEFAAGSNPGNRNSRPDNQSTTTSTTQVTRVTPPPNATPGDLNKQSGDVVNAEGNYLNSSGCGSKSTHTKDNPVHYVSISKAMFLTLSPLLFALFLRRRKK